MRAGLAASTVTPGSTPPDASFTTPVIEAWAYANDGAINKSATTTNNPTSRCIHHPFSAKPIHRGCREGRIYITTTFARNPSQGLPSRPRSSYGGQAERGLQP